jgi:hypothetical protein
MAIQIPNDELPDDPTQSFSVKPGTYHVRIADVDEDGGKNGEMIVNYEVLAGTTPDQEASMFKDYYHKTQKASGRMMSFAIAVGLMTLDEYREIKRSGKSIEIEFTDAVGRQMVVDLYEDEYEGKKRTKCGYGLYRVDDKRVFDKGVPLNMGMIKEFAKIVKLSMPEANGKKPAADRDPFGGAI